MIMYPLQTLQAQGYQSLPCYRTGGLHPLTISLVEGTIDVWGQKQQGVLCFLRWPQPAKQPNMEVPLVLMQRGQKRMQLVARSAKEYITRLLMEEDLAAGAV